jgi:hypothetical protein
MAEPTRRVEVVTGLGWKPGHPLRQRPRTSRADQVPAGRDDGRGDDQAGDPWRTDGEKTPADYARIGVPTANGEDASQCRSGSRSKFDALPPSGAGCAAGQGELGGRAGNRDNSP